MDKTKKITGGSKVWKLISVLQKCNGKGVIGDSNALISPTAAKVLAVVGLVLLIGLLAAGAFFIEPFIANLIPLENSSKSLMLILLLVSFILSIKNIVTVLYTADDLSVLLPLPFSEGQIVTAKLAVSLRFPVILSLVLINSIGLGFGIRAGMGAAYIVGTVLSSVLVPVTGLAIAVLLVVIVFRLFGFIRNRDITIALGGIFTLALTVAYLFLNSKLQNDGSDQAAVAAVSVFASVSQGFPNIAFMSSFMFDGNFWGLLISIGVTAVVMALAMLAVKLFYLSTALSMQSTATNKKVVSKQTLSETKKTGALKALTSYEAKSTRRNPAYMVYGFAMTFIWPLLFAVPFLVGNNSFFSKMPVTLDTRASLLCALFLGITASCFACGFNILAVSAFSREGSSFSALQALPIDFRDYYKSKRNFSMLICSLGSVLYIIIIGIVCIVTGIVPIIDCWTILYSAGISFLTNLLLINCMLLKNSKKPYFNWDSETEISRKLSWINIVAVVIGVIALIALFVSLGLSAFLSDSANNNGLIGLISVIVYAVPTVSAVIVLSAAFAVNRYAGNKVANNLSELD